MRKLLCLFALGLALAPSPRAQRQDAPAPPPAECDEATRAALLRRLSENYKGDAGQRQNAYEAAKEYVRCCAAAYQDENCMRMKGLVANWIEKYDAAVRRFEAGRDGGALGMAAGEGLWKGLTQPQ